MSQYVVYHLNDDGIIKKIVVFAPNMDKAREYVMKYSQVITCVVRK